MIGSAAHMTSSPIPVSMRFERSASKQSGSLLARPCLRLVVARCHGLLSLARAVGPSGEVYGVDISAGMIAVARRHIELAGLQNVTLTMGDARLLALRSNRFDAVFMSFALELFESAMPQVLAEVRRVLRSAGRVGVVAMAESGQSNAMTIVYNWAHRRWPHVVDCGPIDLTGALQAARFQTRVAAAVTIWGLPVVAAIGLKAVDKDGAGR
jgi:SAM-dependent methyltransferase